MAKLYATFRGGASVVLQEVPTNEAGFASSGMRGRDSGETTSPSVVTHSTNHPATTRVVH